MWTKIHLSNFKAKKWHNKFCSELEKIRLVFEMYVCECGKKFVTEKTDTVSQKCNVIILM